MEENKITFKDFLVPISIIIAGIIIGVALVFTQKIKLPQPSSQEKRAPVNISISSDDHIRGDLNASITIVEFSDFQCPYCKAFHPTMKKIIEDYQGKVRWVYKHFPLDSIHPEARSAAEASECVFEQKGNDGFWQFNDLLFENQQRLGKDLYLELAKKLGLNIKQFEDCINSRKYKDKVENEFKLGLNLGVGGTPTSFINGTNIVIEGAYPYDYVKSLIDEILQKTK